MAQWPAFFPRTSGRIIVAIVALPVASIVVVPQTQTQSGGAKGFGFIIGARNGHALVATANHVARTER
jgi:hypothetical protein